jgi:hypothetical protein
VPGATQLVKAYIYNEDKRTQLDCLFNPTQYTFVKANTWRSQSLTGSDVPTLNFMGGGPMVMQFELFFDTYAPDEPDTTKRNQIAGQDVRTYTEVLLNLMKIDPSLASNDKAKAGRPPICSFHWGNYWSFKGVITDVTLSFTLFTNEGKPVRARATVSLQQVEQEGTYPRQNPTSGGAGTRPSHVVGPDETLDLIAYQEYGDSTLWRHLARANRLENPRTLRPGQRLIVPSL